MAQAPPLRERRICSAPPNDGIEARLVGRQTESNLCTLTNGRSVKRLSLTEGAMGGGGVVSPWRVGAH